ncbi:MAG: bile acid:sodium symporter family protein [Planctomycetota bacterium]|nr:bile acid:sodium symporter family protein [Planctomycetota bacterium]
MLTLVARHSTLYNMAMLQRYLILWLVLSSLIALMWPDGTTGMESPFVASTPYLSYLIGLTMFCVGCLLPPDEMRQVVRRWPTVLFGTGVQYLAMPALAYVMAHLFEVDTTDRIGIIIVGVVPGAMASNVLTMTARGNVSYSVSLTTSATLLSPVVVPFGLWLLLGAELPVEPLKVALQLLREVVLPVVAGFTICRFSKRFEHLATTTAPTVANVVILWIIAVVVALNRNEIAKIHTITLLALFSVNVIGYLTGYNAARLIRLPEKMRRALTIEVGMQNAGVGTVLALKIFPETPAVAIPTATYTFGCMLTATILAWYWSRRAPDDMIGDVEGVHSVKPDRE